MLEPPETLRPSLAEELRLDPLQSNNPNQPLVPWTPDGAASPMCSMSLDKSLVDVPLVLICQKTLQEQEWLCCWIKLLEFSPCTSWAKFQLHACLWGEWMQEVLKAFSAFHSCVLLLKVRRFFCFVEGWIPSGQKNNNSADTQAPEALELRSCRTPFALRHWCLFLWPKKVTESVAEPLKY